VDDYGHKGGRLSVRRVAIVAGEFGSEEVGAADRGVDWSEREELERAD
jgi:hypothetical protein